MNIHLLTEVGTYMETGERLDVTPVISPSTQATAPSVIQINVFDPQTRSLLLGTPIRDGDLVGLQTRFGGILDIPVGTSILRADSSLTTPSIPTSVFRIVSLDGSLNGLIADGARVAFRRVVELDQPPIGPGPKIIAIVDTDAWMTVDRNAADHPISFRNVPVFDDLRATEAFRFLLPVKLFSFVLANMRATIPYQGSNTAIANLSIGNSVALPGGSLFRIELTGDTTFAATNDFRVTLPQGESSMSVEIKLTGHAGKLDGCTAQSLNIQASEVATGGVLAPQNLLQTLQLDAGHIPFMRMTVSQTRWATLENQGCLARLFPGLFTPNDQLVDAYLNLLPHPSLAPADLPIRDVKISAEDPALLVFPLTSAELSFDRPIGFIFGVRNPRRQPRHCGSIRVEFTLAGGKIMEARFAVLFLAGGVSLDPFFE